MPVSIPLIMAMLIALLASPPDRNELKVERYDQGQFSGTVLMRRTPEGFSGQQDGEEMKFQKVATNIKLPIKEGPIIHLVRKSGKAFIRILPRNEGEFSEEQNIMIVVY